MSEEQNGAQTGQKGRFVRAHHFFSTEFRGTFARYERPEDNGEVKRCLRVEIRRRQGDAHIKMELDVGTASELHAVVNGHRKSMSLRIPNRAGGAKVLTVQIGTEKDWVMTMEQRAAKNEPMQSMTMPFNKSSAIYASVLCVESYPDCAGELGSLALVSPFRNIGALAW